MLDYVRIGREENAVAVAGGNAPLGELQTGFFVEPTVFASVDNRMRIAREEIFGPVVSRSHSTTYQTRSRKGTIHRSVWRPAFGRGTSEKPTRPPPRSTPARCGSTVTMRSTTPHRGAALNKAVGVAKRARMASTSSRKLSPSSSILHRKCGPPPRHTCKAAASRCRPFSNFRQSCVSSAGLFLSAAFPAARPRCCEPGIRPFADRLRLKLREAHKHAKPRIGRSQPIQTAPNDLHSKPRIFSISVLSRVPFSAFMTSIASSSMKRHWPGSWHTLSASSSAVRRAD